MSNSKEGERNFGHICVFWEIENFCFGMREKNLSISGPNVLLNKPHLMRWGMKLNTKLDGEGDYIFCLNLEKLLSKTDDNVIWTDLKFWFINSEAKERGTSWYSSFFEENCPYEIKLWNVNYVCKELGVMTLETCSLKIVTQMIVHFDNFDQKLTKSLDAGFRCLSEDLMCLFRNGTYHDVILRTKDKDFKAHKVICAQSSVLEDLINKNKNEVIDLSSFDGEAMMNILAYLYSGSLDYVGVMPSILTYDYAQYFRIHDVEEYYCPEHLHINSVIDVLQHSFLWVIPSKEFESDSLSSSLFTSKFMDTTWKLSLHKKCSDEYFSIYADIVEGSKLDNSCLLFSIGTDSKRLTKKLNLSGEKGTRFGYEKFFPKDSLQQMIDFNDETVKIFFLVEIHTDTISSTDKYTFNCISAADQQFYGANIFPFLKNEKYADVTIESDNTIIKAHKCILSARSRVFDSMLKEMTDSRLVLNLKSNMLSIVLNYIYSGVFSDYNLRDIMNVYETAEELAVVCLKNTCSRILTENLHLMHTCDVFDVLSFSTDKKESKLKKRALEVLNLHKNEGY